MMRSIAWAQILAVLLPYQAQAQSITPEQHQKLMSSVSGLTGTAAYRKRAGAHGAIAVCINSADPTKFDGGTLQASNDGGGLNFCTFESDGKTLGCLTLTLEGVQTADVASLKEKVLDACRSKEKRFPCRCALADVDGQLP